MYDVPFYTSKKGKRVEVKVTFHALVKFQKRWKILTGENVQNNIIANNLIITKFNKAVRQTNLSKKAKSRLKKHGQDTMYFKTEGITFVVQGATIVTIEISEQRKRRLNRPSLSTLIRRIRWAYMNIKQWW